MKNIIAAGVLAATLHAGVWVAFQETKAPPDFRGYINSLSYSPYRSGQDPKKARNLPTAEQMDRDLALLSNFTKGVRTYTAQGVESAVPGLAGKYGLNVSVGAWVGKGEEGQNLREIRDALQLARANLNVRSLIVGNEAILRKELTADELITLLRFARKRSRVPVSTGEVWHEWLANPRLANEVDFIAAHVLAYWEGVPADAAVNHALQRYEDLRRAFPGKKIVIMEFGWPSQGYNNKDAVPDPIVQAEVLRRFIVEAEKRGIEYNVIEAFDQPWKTMEGGVGQYWGIFDAHRQPKFLLTGSVTNRQTGIAFAALGFGALLTLLGLVRRRPRLLEAVIYGIAANALGAGVAIAGAYPFSHYLNVGATVMWVTGMALMLPLIVVTLAKVSEITSVMFGRTPTRLIGPRAPRGLVTSTPKVSVHVPAYREPPAMLKATLDSLARLDYPNFEVVLVINNTPEEHYWKPIEEHCRLLGPRFKFLNFPKLAGFKAGALNAAISHTAPDAEIIGLLDADYVVHPDWLKDLVPVFAEPAVGLVQAPQDHRDGAGSLFKTAMNAEYAGFFDIGMVQRNEHDAIIQHGTMCLIRRSALDRLGGWSSETIVEDTEFGLRLLESGYRSLYTNRRYGWGVLPDTLKAFQTQRHRWAYGAVQVIRKHWPHMVPGARTLTGAQKVQFVNGWLCWLSEALGAAAAFSNLLWVPAILFIGVLIPTIPLTLPIAGAFAVNLLHCLLLYRARVRAPLSHILGAAIASMSLQLTVAKAVLTGVLRPVQPFQRTDKGGNARPKKTENPARWETGLGVLLLLSAVVLFISNEGRIAELQVFAATLVIQALPFLAATWMRVIEQVDARRPVTAADRAFESPALDHAVTGLSGSISPQAAAAPIQVIAAMASASQDSVMTAFASAPGPTAVTALSHTGQGQSAVP